MKKIYIFGLFITLLSYSCKTRVESPLTDINNKTPGITVNQPSTLLVSESGTTSSLSVQLDSSPSGIVTISVSISNPAEATIIVPFSGPSGTLTFDPTTWDIPQVITVQGIDDFVADGNQSFTLAFGIPASTDTRYNGNFKPVDIVFTNVDVETPGVTVKSAPSALLVSKSGLSSSFEVVLNSKPLANVSLPVSVSNTAEGTITAPFTSSSGTLTFTTTDWNIPQTVTVKGVADNIASGNIPFTVNFGTISSTDSTYNGYVKFTQPAPVNFINIDNNKAGITVNAGTTMLVSESGTTQSFQVVLNSQPAANVTMTVATSNSNEGTIIAPFSGASGILTFTPATWSTPITVTVQGVPDLIADGNKPFSIVLGTSSSTDPVYNGTFTPAPVNFINVDTDKAGVTVTQPTTFLVDENGVISSSFSIVLNSIPTGSVTLPLFSNYIGRGTVSGPITGDLITFLPGNWNTPQTFTVTGVVNASGSNLPFAIVIGSTISSDPVYNNKFDPPDLNFIDVDNTASGISIYKSDALLTNGNIPTQDFFEVVLNSPPVLIASLSIQISNITCATFVSPSPGNPITISFDSTNWNIPQKIVVQGAVSGTPGFYNYIITVDPAASTDPVYQVMTPIIINGYNTE